MPFPLTLRPGGDGGLPRHSVEWLAMTSRCFVSTFRFSVRKSYIEGWRVGLDKSYIPLLASTVLDMLDAYTPGRSPVHTT